MHMSNDGTTTPVVGATAYRPDSDARELPAPRPRSADPWYSQPGAVDTWLCGVFEGGGAKGVAFAGSLAGVREQRCWFAAVAGASAGAITATLVAAGLAPEEIEAQTELVLGRVRTGVWAGLRRLRDKTGYFPSDDLRTYLDDLLRARVTPDAEPTDERITFRHLHAATGIELNVVAADLSLRRQIVFSHLETPECAVADAVTASAAIPFAFRSGVLQVPSASGDGVFHHTIVDGGVWSNFPMFVFEDRAFRSYYGRTPEVIPPDRIVGFLLEEPDAEPVPRGSQVLFPDGKDDVRLRAREWHEEGAIGNAVRPTAGSRIFAWLLLPFAFLGRLVTLNGGVEPGRWPRPRSAVARNLLDSVNGLLTGLYPPLLGLVAFTIILGGARLLIGATVSGFADGIANADWSDWETYMDGAFFTIFSVLAVAVAILMAFASLLAIVANRLLLRSIRRIFYGLAATYVAGPGAPEWATRRPNIIGLPIPPTVGTLSFEMKPEVRRELVDSARRATVAKLGALLARRS